MKKKGLFARVRDTFRSIAYLSDPAAWFKQYIEGRPVASGIAVNESTALDYSAYFACLKVLSEALASLPVFLYERIGNGKERAINHPLYNLLHLSPNEYQTVYEFKEMMMAMGVLYGNSYALIIRNPAGEITEIFPLLSWNMKPEILNNKKIYTYKVQDQKEIIYQDWEILHIPSISLNGIKGFEPIQRFKQIIGLGLATEEFGARFFNNDARPGGVIEHPARLNIDTAKRMKDSWELAHRDLENKHKVAILEEGAKFKEIGIAPEHAQFLETRKFQIEDIARVHRVQPHLVGDLTHSTYTNIEHQSLEFVKYTMLPYFVRWEQRLTMQLLTIPEKKKYFFEFLVDGLLRGDVKSRYESYRIGREIGVLSANDIRERENMNAIEDGDKYFVPLNWVEVGKPSEKNIEGKSNVKFEKRDIEYRVNTIQPYKELYQKGIQDFIIYEVKEIKNIAKHSFGQRDLKEFNLEVDKFYNKIDKQLKRSTSGIYKIINDSAIELFNKKFGYEIDLNDYDVFLDMYIESFVNRYIGYSKNNIIKTLGNAIRDKKEVDKEIEILLDYWYENKARFEAEWEANRAFNAITHELYKTNGYKTVQWVNSGKDNCPYCKTLDGKQIKVEDFFTTSTEPVESSSGLYFVSYNVGHPPLHSGCDCQLIPV